MTEPTLDSPTPEWLRGRRTVKWTLHPADVLPMWVAEMDFPVAEPIRAALHRAVDAETLGYPSPLAAHELAKALAHWQQQTHGWRVRPEDVHVLGDVMQGVELALDHFSRPGEPVVIPCPVYMPFFDVVRLSGRPDVPVPMTWDASAARHTLDLEGINAALAAGARTVLLCSPHNPLGRVFTREELLGLAAVVQRHGASVVSDEIHAPLTFDRPHLPYAALTPETAAHTVTVLSASKAWNLPGLKCAQVITNPTDTPRWKRIPFWRTVGVSTLGIEANIAAYRDGAPWLDAVRSRLAANRTRVAEAIGSMPGVRTVPNEGTYLQWLDFTELGLDVEPAQWLLENARVAVNPGPPFGAPAHRFARLNFATTDAILSEGLARIDGAIRRRLG